MKRRKSIRKKRGGAYREPEPEPEPEPVSEERAYTLIKLISDNIINLKRANASRPRVVREINKRKSLIENYEQTFGKRWIDRGWAQDQPIDASPDFADNHYPHIKDISRPVTSTKSRYYNQG